MFLAPRVVRRPSRTASLESSLDSPGITMEALMAEDELYIERKDEPVSHDESPQA